MTTLVLPALIKPPAAGLVIQKVTHAVGSGANPTIGLDLGTVTSGRLLLCALGNEEGFGSTYASGLKISGGAAMAEATAARATQSISGASQKVQLFSVVNETATGTTNFDVTISTSDRVNLVVYEITGADNADPIGAIQPWTSSSTDVTTTLNTTTAKSLVLSFVQGEENPATAAVGLTEDINVNFQSDEIVFAGHRFAETVGAYAVGCTMSGSFGVGGASWAAEIKPAT